MKYNLDVEFTEDLLGSSPADPDVYAQFIQAKVREAAEEKGDEIETLSIEVREQMGWSVFHKDEKGLLLFDYKIRGFLKSAAEAVTGGGGKSKDGKDKDPAAAAVGLTAYKSKIDKWLFVFPRKIYLLSDNGEAKHEPDGALPRPLRAMTRQGPRVSLKRSDTVKAGTKFSCNLLVLPLGEKDLNEARLREWFDYGALQGMGEWRNASYGRFTYVLTKL